MVTVLAAVTVLPVTVLPVEVLLVEVVLRAEDARASSTMLIVSPYAGMIRTGSNGRRRVSRPLSSLLRAPVGYVVVGPGYPRYRSRQS
jgi:hypothetical protein